MKSNLVIACGKTNQRHEKMHPQQNWLSLDANPEMCPDILFDATDPKLPEYISKLWLLPPKKFQAIYSESFPLGLSNNDDFIKNVSSLLNNRGVFLCNNLSNDLFSLVRREFKGVLIFYPSIALCTKEYLSFSEILLKLKSIGRHGFDTVNLLIDELTKLDQLSTQFNLSTIHQKQLLCCFSAIQRSLSTNDSTNEAHKEMRFLSKLIGQYLTNQNAPLFEKNLTDFLKKEPINELFLAQGSFLCTPLFDAYCEDTFIRVFFDVIEIIMMEFPAIKKLHDDLKNDLRDKEADDRQKNERYSTCSKYAFFAVAASGIAAASTAIMCNLF